MQLGYAAQPIPILKTFWLHLSLPGLWQNYFRSAFGGLIIMHGIDQLQHRYQTSCRQ